MWQDGMTHIPFRFELRMAYMTNIVGWTGLVGASSWIAGRSHNLWLGGRIAAGSLCAVYGTKIQCLYLLIAPCFVLLASALHQLRLSFRRKQGLRHQCQNALAGSHIARDG